GRLDFTRLVPLGARETMVKIGLARLATRLLPVIAPLPLYVLTLPFGGVRIEDVLVFIGLWIARLFEPPDTIEVGLAFNPGRDRERQALASRGAAPAGSGFGAGCGAGITMLFVFGMLARAAIRAWEPIRAGVVGLVGPRIAALLPLSAAAMLARLVST